MIRLGLMNDSSTNQGAAITDPRQVAHRADEILLKLLDGIERDISDGTLPGPHLEAYEALCRAEAARSG